MSTLGRKCVTRHWITVAGNAPAGRSPIRQVSSGNQQIPSALLPQTHQSRAARSPARSRSRSHFTLSFKHLPEPRTITTAVWHDARTIDQRADAQTFKPTQHPYTFRRTAMLINDLSKELDTETMTTVHGGVALTGQVVPTNVQSNELVQSFNIGSKGPVAIANDADQSNYSTQDSFV